MRDLALAEVLAQIDQANSADPTMVNKRPLAQLQGELATDWLNRLSEQPSMELQVAARAHHLRRWEIKRADYPEGRAGYLRWRRNNKAHQASSVAEILEPAGFGADSVTRVQDLLLRTGLRVDPETQTLEDVACLVFVETQFEELAQRTDPDRMVIVVAKTLKKMSPSAIELVGTLALSDQSRSTLAAATSVLEDGE